MRIKHLLTAAVAASLAACGGSSGGDDSTSGSLSLGITDGPVDSAAHVVVEFSGVSIKPASGEVIEFNFDQPKSLDLLALQGNASEPLLSSETVPAGEYEWVRLHVNAEAGVQDSYIELSDGNQLELRIPSGAQTGLKLVSGFTVAAGSQSDFTIDFDLRKSVTNPGGFSEAILRPALRLVNNMEVGTVAGTVDPSLVSQQCGTASTDTDGAVYIYSGTDVTPVDIRGEASDPVVSALVDYSNDAYSYEIGFVAEGDYTLAYTCEGAQDDPEATDDITFVGAANVSVVAGETAEHDFAAQ